MVFNGVCAFSPPVCCLCFGNLVSNERGFVCLTKQKLYIYIYEYMIFHSVYTHAYTYDIIYHSITLHCFCFRYFHFSNSFFLSRTPVFYMYIILVFWGSFVHGTTNLGIENIYQSSVTGFRLIRISECSRCVFYSVVEVLLYYLRSRATHRNWAQGSSHLSEAYLKRV